MNLNEWSVLGVHRIFLITVALALLTASPASAITPPPIDPGALPPDVTGPDQPTEQRVLCASPTTLPGSGFHDPPWSNTYLGVADAHKFATGAGVTVAVIDTGVDASPRVPAEPGGDFVDQAGNGLSDCDAHGTLTASIIAGRPAPTDGFVGVAPDARLLSLRQTSEAFEPVGSQANPNDPNATPAAGSIRSLARAVVHAANLGVGVINISEAACYKVSRPIDETSLGASIDYAVNVKGVVVVVAAGNTGGDCVQNPAPDPSTPGDPRGWNNVQTVVTPAWYAPLVLSVGGIGQTGMPSSFSMHGPWVDVAAPAENIVALGDTGEPVNALQGREGPVPIAVCRGICVGSGGPASAAVPRPDAGADHPPDHRHRETPRGRGRRPGRRRRHRCGGRADVGHSARPCFGAIQRQTTSTPGGGAGSRSSPDYGCGVGGRRPYVGPGPGRAG
ncbi:mycosin MycP1 [Mycobacterium tuberculosis BTB10-422]|nr:mycosin MycP1 [Mycobacterium tuberculosis BTB10-422]